MTNDTDPRPPALERLRNIVEWQAGSGERMLTMPITRAREVTEGIEAEVARAYANAEGWAARCSELETELRQARPAEVCAVEARDARDDDREWYSWDVAACFADRGKAEAYADALEAQGRIAYVGAPVPLDPEPPEPADSWARVEAACSSDAELALVRRCMALAGVE